ncbi:MAG TPA: ATP-binding cassette domain-containing protein [Thermoleophilia bacterium]|nr:ATP-binding cassette domain-containing protein [Thermoleophilia bacterium]
MRAVIQVNDLRKQFNPPDGTVAVDRVSFAVEGGEIFSLLGPNGAGKTTTISMLSCLLRPTGGEAWVAGSSIIEEPRQVRDHLGVVPQEVALYLDLNGRENLRFWGRMYGLSGDELERRIDEVLDLIGLAERQRDRVADYSGGMKRRLNIGVALLHRPEVLFLDEPTVGIDPQSRRSILDGIKDLNSAGMTVLYTTHYMEEAQEISDRIGIMDHGRMVNCGTHAELVRLVGEETRVNVSIDGGPEKVAKRWEGLAGVRILSREGSDLRLLVKDAQDAIPRLFQQAERAGSRLTAITVEEPDLEDVFLHLTGRELRD